MSSRQQDTYIRLRFVEKLSRDDAAFEAGVLAAEAVLIDKEVERGTLAVPAAEPATVTIKAEAFEAIECGGCAPPVLVPAETFVQPPKENTMGRPRKAAEPQVEELKAPDFDRAVKIYRTDIKPANEKGGEEAQKASTGYKAIKRDCHVNTRAAKFVFQLAGESEEKRDDVLRSLRGLLKAMNIGITNDLVARAEGEGADEPIVPAAPTEKLKLVTLDA